MKNFDRYYDPPDEEELSCCEECGHEMEEIDYPIIKFKLSEGVKTTVPTIVCPNVYCPAKFTGEAKDMADMILVLLEQIDRLKIEKNILVNALRDYQK